MILIRKLRDAIPAILICFSLCQVMPASAIATTDLLRTPFGFLHSHNDYQHKRPLMDAVDRGFDSVEADIWLSRGQLLISHLGFIYSGSLKEMYLDPLSQLVAKKGSVHGDGKPFYLWIDIKDGNPELVEVLHTLLEQYSMLTVFSDTEVLQRPVTVILTGNEKAKIAYTEKYGTRHACRDSDAFNIADPQADRRWLWYSLKWTDFFRWGGYSKIKDLEKQKLFSLVKYIHEKGRRVRFWDAPENDSFWQLATEAKVDMLGADRLERLSDFTLHRAQGDPALQGGVGPVRTEGRGSSPVPTF